jgi:5'(3')-deoxyribonucleotidase
MPLKIFEVGVDLDGVLADFDRGFLELCGSTLPMRDTDEDHAWEAIKRTPNFWRRLQPMPGAIAFWEWLKEQGASPHIITSPSGHDTARAMQEKREWVNFWLGLPTPVFFRRSAFKHQLASPHGIIIDDWEANIRRWQKAGGIGIKHVSIESTKSKLLELSYLRS